MDWTEWYRQGQELFVKEHKLEKGDRLKIVWKAKTGQWGWRSHWDSTMDRYIGTIGEILDIEEWGIGLTTIKGSWIFPFFVLEFVEKGKPASPLPEEIVEAIKNFKGSSMVFQENLGLLVQKILEHMKKWRPEP